jgi:hypothetical protein
MEFVFRPIIESEPPAAGTLDMQPAADEHCERLDLAALVLEHGVGSLRQGAGPIERIVVGADPTLAEMFAATIAAELLAGRSLPPGLKPFARYAALAREGLTPSKISLEHSLEGVYLAIRAAAGDDLKEAANGRRFAADWARMSAAIMQAAASGLDPFTKSLFADGSEFSRERAFLANDRAVYGQDVRRGDQWLVNIPGGPRNGRALLLRQPKSLLFKQWSRSEQDSGIGQPFILLAVQWAPGQWVFTTDPTQRLPIKSLAEALQAAEVARDPAAKSDPWFDGKPFGHTLVATPRHGTKLSDAQVLGTVRRWSRARSSSPTARRWLPTAAAVLVLLVVGLYARFHHTPPEPTARGMEFLSVSNETAGQPVGPRDGKDYALIFAADDYHDNWAKLCNAERDAKKLEAILHDKFGFEVEHCLGNDYTNGQFAAKLLEYVNARQFQPNDQLLIYIAGHGERVGRKGYLVATDSAPKNDPSGQRTKTYYSLADLRNDVELIGQRCGHVFLVLDTCFGGMIDFDTATESADRGRDEEMTPTPKAEFIARKMKHRCCAFLTSVGSHPAPDGACGDAGDETHSPFAQQLIKALDASQPGDVLAIPQLVTEVEKVEHQDPRYGPLKGSQAGGDFLFIRK